jgi:uncharacterized Zn finger protein (UPF0148 family)
MLGQHCPACSTVLLQSRQGEVCCVGCAAFCLTEAQLASRGGGAPPTAAATPPSARPAALLSVGAVNTAKGASSGTLVATPESPEAIIGRHLLQGWTMLADTCATAGCYQPLMKLGAAVPVCVVCEASGSSSFPEPEP